MNARVKIAEALADADKDPYDFFGEDDSSYWLRLADAAIGALKASRVAVVDLPEHEVWDGPGRERYWRIRDSTVTVDKWNVPSITLDDDWDDDETPPTTDELRELAAALIAAADLVDGSEGVV